MDLYLAASSWTGVRYPRMVQRHLMNQMIR
jgi:hypothetical protein